MISEQQPMPWNVDLTGLYMGTWNVRSMYRTGTMTTIISCLERFRLDITAVQEVRWDGFGSIKAHGFTIVYSGRKKLERAVGFVIKNTFFSNLVKFKPISDRICYIEFKCRWFNIVIVNCYAPTEDKSEEVKNAFYSGIDRICYGLPSGKPKIIIGDINAKIGRETVYRPTIPTIGNNILHDESNQNDYVCSCKKHGSK